MTVKTMAIVLGQHPMRGQDKKLILLTPKLGLIEAIARNASGGRSKLAASCEVLAYSDFCLFEGKSGYLVNSADLERNFYGLREELISLSLAGYFCELTRFVLPDRDNGAACLKLLLNTLHLLEKKKREPAFLKAVFELRLLTLCGFTPALEGCSSCGGEGELFSLLDGCLFCAGCAEKGLENRPRVLLPKPVLAAMRHICGCPDEKLFSFRLTPDATESLGQVTEAFTLCQTGGKYKSLEFYKTVT